MKTVGIICEYNPFHNGHKFHIQKAKEITGADKVVCVMSGSISQRGEVCIFDKWKRAADAVKNGADLVIELPEYYVLQGADIFSYGAVKLLDSLGIVDCICFGSESGNIDLLNEIADISESEEYNSYVRDFMNQGKSYPVSCSMALSQMGICEIKPNDMLGVAYIRSLKKINSSMKAFSVLRNGTGHNSCEVSDDFASASFIRERILDGDVKNAEKYVPYKIKKDEKIYNEERMFNIIRYVISNMADSDFQKIRGMEPGLGNRIKKALESSGSMKAFLENAVTSRYTASRIRRFVKCAMLNIDSSTELSYVRLLCFNDNGRALIKQIKDRSDLCVINKLADFHDKENIQLEWDINATALSTYCLDNPDIGADDYKMSPVYIK